MNFGISIILKKNQLKMSLNFLSQISLQVQEKNGLFKGRLIKHGNEWKTSELLELFSVSCIILNSI